MRLGDFSVEILKAGTFRLDGGAMFGVVPRTLWEKKMPPDGRNRIGMTMNVLLVQGGGVNLLVDTGAGDKEDAKFRDMYALSDSSLLAELAKRGLGPEDIHVVVNSHLHFDHAGGNTKLDESGRALPVFPNARYLVQRKEYEDAMAANERNKASYLPYNYKPLFDTGQMRLLEGAAEVAPGLSVYPMPGHTHGLQGLLIESRGEKGLFLADCVPTHHHVPIPWIMAYDLYPMTTLETKKRLLPQAAKEGWVLFFEHDPEVRAARIVEEKPMSFGVRPIESSDVAP